MSAWRRRLTSCAFISTVGYLRATRDAKAAILGTILDKLADERGARDKAGELFGKLLKRVNWLRLAGWGGKATMLAHGIPPIGLGLVSDALQKTPDVVKDVVKVYSMSQPLGAYHWMALTP